MDRLSEAVIEAPQADGQEVDEDGHLPWLPIGDTSLAKEDEAGPLLDTGGIDYQQTKVVDVPAWVLQKNRIIANNPADPECANFKILRTQVLQNMKKNNYKTLGIVSVSPAEGKTLVAINLAYSIAMQSQHTSLLVDLDLRKPSVHTYFDYQPEYSITDYFTGDASIQNILFSPNTEGLVVLPGRQKVENSSELLSSRQATELVEELRGRYPDRIVLVDLPPLLKSDDVLAFAPYLDALLLVIESAKVKKSQLVKAMELMKGTPIIGSVLNRVNGPNTW